MNKKCSFCGEQMIEDAEIKEGIAKRVFKCLNCGKIEKDKI